MVALAVKGKQYGVVLVTYGEVEKLAVRTLVPSSRKIVQVVTRQIVKLPKAMIYALGDYRSIKHYIDWKVNRYRSRLVGINRSQKDGVASELVRSGRLAAMGADVVVDEAYYFVPPYLETVLEKYRTSLDGVVVVPMIPVESAFSCGVACQMAMDVFGESLFGRVRVMHGLWMHKELHRIYVDYLFGSLHADLLSDKGRKPGLVLVIHGTIVKGRNGKTPTVFTGLEETYGFFRLMRNRILDDPRNVFGEVRLGCLNHSAGGEWTSDTVEKALSEFRQEGCEAVAMFPFGYFADNSETDYEARRQLDASGIECTQYIPCINASPAFFRWLASLIEAEIGRLDRQHEFFCSNDNEERSNGTAS
jgi:ferrochelatase